jgi:hypothetical protein
MQLSASGALQRQVRLLERLAEIYGAGRMIPVASVQVSGVSFKSIGDPGMEFLEDLAASGVKVQVPTSLNPAGMDRERWREMGVPEDFAQKQLRILDAMERMGIPPTATCTPYLAGVLPHYREHLAWAESSAVSFANSVLGARTNREGGPSALASALTGVTPEYGLHLDEKRKPTVRLVVRCGLPHNSDFGALGLWAGKKIKDGIPYIEGIERATTDDLKALGAAMAASGAVALYHARGLTPEADRFDGEGLPVIEYREEDRAQTLRAFDAGKRPDIVLIGCPHASIQEIAHVAERLKGRRLNRPLWMCTSRTMKRLADDLGHTRAIEDAGGKLLADTCMVVSPMESMGYAVSGVTSGKAANYLPGFCKQEVVFRDVDALIEEALS